MKTILYENRFGISILNVKCQGDKNCFSEVGFLLTYCCRAVLQTAIQAARKPLKLTLTSVTVQNATPRRTTTMLSFVSLEYRTWSKTTSRKQDTGIILSFAIWKEKTTRKFYVNATIRKAYGFWHRFSKTYLVKSNRVPHQTDVHSNNGEVGEQNKFQDLTRW